MGRTHRRRIKKRKQPSAFTHDLLPLELYLWMGGKGFEMKRMKLAVFHDTGRGLKAYENITAGDVLISVPLSKLITCETVMKSYLQKVLLRHYSNLSAVEILSVFLMCEKLQDVHSEWGPYINCLPSQYSLPACFPEECLRFLPSIMQSIVKEQAFTVEKNYGKLKPLLNDIERSFPQFHGSLTYILFRWAWASVNTRCVYMKCGKADCNSLSCKQHLALAPFLDFLNHSPNVQVTAGFNSKTNCYEIVHHNNIQKYEQVFINYGSHSNHKLFMEYGFVVRNNLYDHVQFNWGKILETFILLNDMHIREKVIFLNNFDLIRNIGCEGGGLTWNFAVVLKVLSSKKCKREQLQDLLSDTSSLDAEENTIYRSLLCQLINLKIQEFSSSFDKNDLKELTEFSKDCLELTEQLCSENRKLLLNCLTAVT